jgi:hypothetical protein
MPPAASKNDITAMKQACFGVLISKSGEEMRTKNVSPSKALKNLVTSCKPHPKAQEFNAL